MSDGKFKVIIVGAGPVGLYLAHALSQAGIDFVVLEQQETALNYHGAMIFTWPHTVRLFDQIGLSKMVVDAAVVHLQKKKRVYGIDGTVTTVSRFWDFMQQNHGYPFVPVLRSDLNKILYENLEDHDTKVKTSARVVDIETNSDGVVVRLKDGRVETGSIVVGADGVHSQTRTLMQGLAEKAGAFKVEENPMLTTFYGVFGRASNTRLGIEPGVLFESRGSGAVVQCTGNEETIFFVALKPIAEPTTARKRYTEQEMEEYASTISNVAVCPGVNFGDLWHEADKSRTRLLNQEEGFVERWHYDRIVLVGDSAHKTTSINGLGLTCGLHSAAALANELHGLLSVQNNPSTSSLGEAFTKYRQVRQDETKIIWDQGWSTIRQISRKSWALWAWDKFVLPWFDMEKMARGILVSLLLVRNGQALSYVPFVGMSGSVPWRQHAKVGGDVLGGKQ